MMTNPCSQAAVASVLPDRERDEMATDPAVAARTLSDVIAAISLYKAYMARHIWNSPVHPIDDQKELDCQYERLSDFEALIVLILVWKESCHLTDEDLFCAGLPRKFPNGITRKALGRGLRNSDGRPDEEGELAEMFARRASRIVEAAITYGLVENGEVRANFKRLHATKKLHDMLLQIGSAAAALIHEPFGCTLTQLQPSINGAGDL